MKLARVFLTMAVALSALGSVGCGGMAPLRVGEGQNGAVRPVPFDGSSESASNAAVCVISWSGGAQFSLPNLPRAGYRFLPREDFGSERCDALAKIRRTGITVYATSFVDVYSPFGGIQVAHLEAEGAFGPILGYERIGRYLQDQLSYDTPLRRSLAATQGARARLTSDELSALAGPDALTWDLLLSEAVGAEAKAGIRKQRERGWSPVEKPEPPAQVAAKSPPPAPPAPISDLDELPPPIAERPHSYAIVVGVERYREKLPDAEFAAADAKAVSRYFHRSLGVPEENIALLVDERAAKSDFEKYFERWLPNRVEAGDTVYVYFSGHGAPNPAKGDSYLVPFDGDPTYIDQTGFAVKRLFDDLAKLPAKQVFVAMDSCFSGAGGRSVIAKGARPLVTVTQNAVPANLTVLSASAGDQISNGYQDKGHGLFTYYLLKGLKEKGGDLRAAFDYAKPEVARAARRDLNADQDPQWRQGN